MTRSVHCVLVLQVGTIRGVSLVAAARTRVSDWRHLGRIALSGRSGGRPIAVVYGNCQAEPLRAALRRSPTFEASYQAVRVPPVHEIRSGQCKALAALMGRCELLITQPVREAYRALPIGSQEMMAQLPRQCRVVQIPVLYYEGLHPYQVYISTGGELSEPAPRTGYHDLRTLAAAAAGQEDVTTEDALSKRLSLAAAFREIARTSQAQLAERERSLDVAISDLLEPSSDVHDRSFLTVNHPSNALIDALADRVLTSIQLGPAVHPPRVEDLGAVSAPVDSDVAEMLALTNARVGTDWSLRGTCVPERELFKEHLDWYAQNRHVVDAGVAQHRVRLHKLGLL